MATIQLSIKAKFSGPTAYQTAKEVKVENVSTETSMFVNLVPDHSKLATSEQLGSSQISTQPFIHPFTYLPIYPSTLPICSSICPFIHPPTPLHPSIYLPIHLPIYPSNTYPPIHVPLYPSTHPSICPLI
jgi:hypothetical protein